MEPDLVLLNGTIYTMEKSNPQVEALWAHGDRLQMVGTNAEVRAAAPASAEVIDLRGLTAVPGLIDCHTHFAMYALGLEGVDFEGASSLAETLQRVAAKAKDLRPGEWLLGHGWNSNTWPEGRLPNRQDLDAVAPSNPAAFTSKDCHSFWVNSLALDRAGISERTADPEGGSIQRRPGTGVPTGILWENAEKLIYRVIPEPTTERIAESIHRAIRHAHHAGVTGIHRFAAFEERPEEFRAFQQLRRDGRLDLRVYMLVPQRSLDGMVSLGLQTGLGDEYLRLGPLKLFADGALGSRTAAMLEPYEDDRDNTGIVVTERQELSELVRRAVETGISVAIHAIGDRANRNAIDAVEANINEIRRHGLRTRMEHVQLLQPSDLPRLARLGITASVQPAQATSDIDMVERGWGARGRWAYTFRSLIDAGVRLAFGSDCPVEELSPLKGIYAAITRQRENGEPAGGWYPEQRLSASEALEAYTVNAAYISGEESIKGSLAPGKLADVTILSEDILRCRPGAILQTKVVHTILGGRVVYSA